MAAASRWRSYYALVGEVRQWARSVNRSTLDVIACAVSRYLDYEASPHCERCDSTDLDWGEDEYETGVYAPDGGAERRTWEYMWCRRCGNKEPLDEFDARQRERQAA